MIKDAEEKFPLFLGRLTTFLYITAGQDSACSFGSCRYIPKLPFKMRHGCVSDGGTRDTLQSRPNGNSGMPPEALAQGYDHSGILLHSFHEG